MTLAIALVLTCLTSFGAFAQNCYYPDGTLDTSGVAACESQGGACCPLNWACTSNGLCYLESEDFYGRYTCTDQTWQSSSCPGICTQDNTASGNEAILWCPNGNWCCDGNRSFDCCAMDDMDFFALPRPTPIAFISSVQSPTPEAEKSVSNSPASTSGNQYSSSTREAATTSSTSRTSRTSKSSAEPVSTTSARTTITQEAVTTGQDGSVSTLTELITPVAAGSTETSNAQSSDDSGPNLGMIVGLAVGIPLVLIIAAILIVFLLRRRRKSKKYEVQSRPQSPPMEANYSNIAPGSHAPELDSYPVAPAQDKSGRKSELYGSDTYGHSPALSVSTNGSFPPQYSPGNRTEPMTQIQEEPQELWGGYVPYRPPRTQ